MSIAAIGWDSQIGLAEETTYGTPVTTSTHWLPIVSHSVQCNQKIDPVPFLSSGNAAFNNVRDDALLGHDVGGEIETIPAYESTAFALLLMYAMGDVSTGAGPPYIHTFTPSIAATNIEGLSIQSIDGSQADLDMAARGQWFRMMREIGVYSVNEIRTLEDALKLIDVHVLWSKSTAQHIV